MRHQTTQLGPQEPYEGVTEHAEHVEAVTGLNAETADEVLDAGMEVLPVTVVDPVRTRPFRPRRFVTGNLSTDAMLNNPVQIIAANPKRRRVVIQSAGGGVIRIGNDASTVAGVGGYQMPNNTQLEILADGDIWAVATAAAFNLFYYAEYDD